MCPYSSLRWGEHFSHSTPCLQTLQIRIGQKGQMRVNLYPDCITHSHTLPCRRPDHTAPHRGLEMRALFLVAVATGKGLPSLWVEERNRDSRGGFQPTLVSPPQVSTPRCIWCSLWMNCGIWGLSEGLLQGFWMHLHQLRCALGATCPGTMV